MLLVVHTAQRKATKPMHTVRAGSMVTLRREEGCFDSGENVEKKQHFYTVGGTVN